MYQGLYNYQNRFRPQQSSFGQSFKPLKPPTSINSYSKSINARFNKTFKNKVKTNKILKKTTQKLKNLQFKSLEKKEREREK